MVLTTHPLLALKLRMSEAIPLHPLFGLRAYTETKSLHCHVVITLVLRIPAVFGLV
jgi:hypothetical protein